MNEQAADTAAALRAMSSDSPSVLLALLPIMAAVLIAFLIIGLPLFFLGDTVNVFLGLALAFAAIFIIMAILSAAQTIFISAVYHNINGDVTKHFDQQLVDGLFVKKENKFF